MGYANGHLPQSALAPIAGGHLYKPAAAAWNAMNVASRNRYGVNLYPLGAMSSYRTYAQQVYLWNTVPHAHDPNWVAVPGTSNHGLGLAVDVKTQHMRWIIDQIGKGYGWSKGCSDAPVEWWHIKYNPSCTRATWHGHDPGPNGIQIDPRTYLMQDERHWLDLLAKERDRASTADRRSLIRQIKKEIVARIKKIEKLGHLDTLHRRERLDLLRKAL